MAKTESELRHSAKENGGRAAFPENVDMDYRHQGLTKRERFAMAFHAAILAGDPYVDCGPEGVAKDAVAQADALLIELAK